MIEIRGRVIDAGSRKPLPARVNIHHLDSDQGFHARSADPAGSAVPYGVKRFERSIETHTTLSAHPFVADVPEGEIKIIAEHGPEFATRTWK